jgi:hypothetical protein
MSFIGKAVPVLTHNASATTLFHLAAELLGDATQWTRLAAFNADEVTINDFIDPWITVLTPIDIPGPGKSNGGILIV